MDTFGEIAVAQHRRRSPPVPPARPSARRHAAAPPPPPTSRAAARRAASCCAPTTPLAAQCAARRLRDPTHRPRPTRRRSASPLRTDLAKNGGGDDRPTTSATAASTPCSRDNRTLAPKTTRSRCCRATQRRQRRRRGGREKGAAHEPTAAAAAPVAPADAAALARALRAQCGGCGRARGDVAGAVGGGPAEAAVRRCRRVVRCGAPSLWTLCAVVWWNPRRRMGARRPPAFALPLPSSTCTSRSRCSRRSGRREDYYVLMPGTLEGGSKIDVVPACATARAAGDRAARLAPAHLPRLRPAHRPVAPFGCHLFALMWMPT